MDEDIKISNDGQDLFVKYSDEISAACQRAVREALLKHKRAGNPVAISRDGRVVWLQPEDIEIT